MSTGKIISFEDYKNKVKKKSIGKKIIPQKKTLIALNNEIKKAAAASLDVQKKFECVMVWLFCPKCELLTYTHTRSPNGRIHKCGSLVKEKEIIVNVRREYSIALLNMQNYTKLFDELDTIGTKLLKDENNLRNIAVKAIPKKNKKNQTSTVSKEKPKDKNLSIDLIEASPLDAVNNLYRHISSNKKKLLDMLLVAKRFVHKEIQFIERLKLAINEEIVPLTDKEIREDEYIKNAPTGPYNAIVSEFHSQAPETDSLITT